ncbi:MAG: competence/damage-inducible protein A [Acidobacteriota bacterium]
MKAMIIAVGSEMLGTQRLDTNSLKLTAVLDRFGIELIGKSVIGDSESLLATELRRRSADADLVLVTGGLGPTADDVTRPAVADAFDRGLAIDEDLVEHMRQRFAQYGRVMPEVNRRQGEVIEGATILANRRGTAPGQRVDVDASGDDAGDDSGQRASIFLFPGVPRELVAMIEDHLIPWLQAHSGDAAQGRENGVIKVACIPESALEERIAPAYERFGRENISVLASPGDIKIYFTATGSETERRAELASMRQTLSELAGRAVYTDREDDVLETVVGRLATAAGRTITTAESCTGGLVAERLTRIPGSSAYFQGGVVSYTNELKMQLLGVPKEYFVEHGAVSEPVARAMAQGVRERYGSDYGVGITGVAGPGGGSEDKPVGTVHLAVAGPGADDVEHRKARFPGSREMVRQQSAQLVLELLRRDLLTRQPGSAAGD